MDTGLAEDAAMALPALARIERHVGGTRAHDAECGDDQRMGSLQQQRHAIARSDTARTQAARQVGDRILEL